VHHDLWDHDNASRPVLCTVKRGGKSIDAVVVVTKTGFCFVLDRVTGKPIYPVREVPAEPSQMPGEKASPTQPEPVLPPALSETVFTEDHVTNLSPESTAFVRNLIRSFDFGKKYMPPTARGTIVSPGYFGGSPWSGASFDPRSNTLFVNANNVPGIMSNPANYRLLLDPEGYPGVKPPWGTLTAISLDTGAFRWRRPLGEYTELTRRGVPITGTLNLGGTLVTAGNLVFVGATCDQKLRAFDSRSGKLLLEYTLPASAFAAPATYSIKGRQYVVIAASGGGYAKRFGQDRGPVSDTFVCLALPK
jgi:quinoprotein glucose dehydrogenase